MFWVKWCLTIFRDLPINGDNFVSTDHSFWLSTLKHFRLLSFVNFPSEEEFLFKKYIKIEVVFFPLGYDVIAQAQSGTGKTATFAISILQQLDIEQKETQALVLAPTRELAQQVCNSCVTLPFNHTKKNVD